MRTERRFLENFISSIGEPAVQPDGNVSRSRYRMDGFLNVHDTVNLLTGGCI